jgi:DNA polymerase-3 subunit gamma/tau
VTGPTAEPCGVCEPCIEIAEGRDIDVLEIDAATHTGVDNVREVIIAGLGIMPVRNRYKIFIIDEVHQLSSGSFNALLKSIEEPPPHVVFMMATTELDKIPETVLSRSQVHEFRAIGARPIAEQLRKIVDAEGITIADESLQLIARDADGSMRDAESKLDQVIAFTGNSVGADDVATVLGLVGRDLLLDTVDAVAREDAPAAFTLVARAVEMGYDLRNVCRELSRVVRDLLVLSVDASRATDPEIAGEGEVDRLKELARQFSREDLLRAFDVLTKAETDIRGAAQPRYHLEIALLRWMYLRKLVTIEELIAGAPIPASAPRPTSAPAPSAPSRPAATPAPPLERKAAPPPATPLQRQAELATRAQAAAPHAAAKKATTGAPVAEAGFKDALLAEIRSAKVVFYNTVVAQAQRIDVAADRVTFTFSSAQRALRDALEQNRTWLETLAQQVGGRKITVVGVQTDATAVADTQSSEKAGGSAETSAADRKSALREQAMADAGVRALLEVFPAEIRDIEEM